MVSRGSFKKGIIGLVGFLLMLTPLCGADIQVSSTQIVSGEELAFKLSAKGDEVHFPDIDKIGGFEVSKGHQSSSTRQSYSNINGKAHRENITTHSQTYLLYPTKSLTIPALSIEVDGKKEYTKPVKVALVTKADMNKKIPYRLRLFVSDKSPYVGQMIRLKVRVELDERLQIGDLRLEKSSFTGLSIKNKPTQSSKNENGYRILELEYWASALKKGKLHIKPVEVHLGFSSNENDVFSALRNAYAYKTIRSNSLDLKVKALPRGVSVVGDFKISASVDKKKVLSGKPVNVRLRIEGKGNLSELGSIKAKLENGTVYEDKPKLEVSFKKGVYESKWEQKIAYVGSKNFTIEPFVFSFLDAKSGKVKTLKTKPIRIKVKGKVQQSQKTTQVSVIEKPSKTKIVVKKEGISPAWLILSFVLGMVLMFILLRLKLTKPKKPKIFKSNKDILQEILPLKGKNEELDAWIKKLEDKIYGTKKEKIDAKRIQKILKDQRF